MLVFTSDLHDMIDKFLERGRAESVNGGFPMVLEDDLELLYDITNCLIDRKWDTDADNDAPVEVKLIDRNVYQSMNFALVTYRSIDKEQHQRDVAFNVGQAIDEMKLYLDLNKIEERN